MCRCAINFAEAFTMLMHLKAIRIFVESVLRYGAITLAMHIIQPHDQQLAAGHAA